MSITQATLDKLAKYDTPTICNGLEVVAPDRRGHGFTTKPFVCAHPELGPMVGFARTANSSSESLDGFIQFRIEIPRRRTKDG